MGIEMNYVSASAATFIGLFLSVSIVPLASGDYMISDSTMSWSDGNDYCASEWGTTMATITNDEDAEELRELVDSSGGPRVWIGLGKEDGEWAWSSGYPCEGDDCVDLTYWSNNQPDGNGDCVWLWYHDTIDNLLDDYPCSSNQKVACDLSSPLEADYVYGDRMALQQCSQDGNNHPIIYSESMTFAECKATCATLVADDGSPCVAVEWSDSGVDQNSDHEATCYFAWGCDDTISWSGGSVYMLEGATETCPAADMYGVNWHEFLNEDLSTDVLLHESGIAFNASTLSLTFSAALEYVGLSADGNFDNDYVLGTTYWIDFHTFSGSVDSIDAVGSCGNRDETVYDGLDFADYWSYPSNPEDLGTTDTDERMAYPASAWTLSADGCDEVGYERTLSWTQLTSCTDAEGEDVVTVTQTTDQVLLEGTFYVMLVSPYSMDSDEYYRSLPLVQQDFAIALMRTVHVLASTGQHMFRASVMGYAHPGVDYEMIILVQVVDYVQLGMDNDVTAISWPDGVTVTNVQTISSVCLVASSFTCGQIFSVTIAVECDEEDPAIDLSGNYQFAFPAECREGDTEDTEACDNYLDTLVGDDGIQDDVVLDVDSTFVDDCSVDLFEVTFEGALVFYFDANFTEEVVDGSEPFVIGQDTIYGKVTVDIPDDEDGEMYRFVNVTVETVYVCTSDDDLSLTLDSDSGIGGCFSSSIDADGPYTVIGTDQEEAYEGTTYGVGFRNDNNEAAFSFLTFDTPRETIYVHVQLLMTLATESGLRRRRMLLSTDGVEGNSLKSYLGTAAVQEGLSPIAQLERLVEDDITNQWWFWLLSFVSVFIIVAFVTFKLTQNKGVAFTEVIDESATDAIEVDEVENQPFVQNGGL